MMPYPAFIIFIDIEIEVFTGVWNQWHHKIWCENSM